MGASGEDREVELAVVLAGDGDGLLERVKADKGGWLADGAVEVKGRVVSGNRRVEGESAGGGGGDRLAGCVGDVAFGGGGGGAAADEERSEDDDGELFHVWHGRPINKGRASS